MANNNDPSSWLGTYDAGLSVVACPIHKVPLQLVGSSFCWRCPTAGEQWDPSVSYIGPLPTAVPNAEILGAWARSPSG